MRSMIDDPACLKSITVNVKDKTLNSRFNFLVSNILCNSARLPFNAVNTFEAATQPTALLVVCHRTQVKTPSRRYTNDPGPCF